MLNGIRNSSVRPKVPSASTHQSRTQPQLALMRPRALHTSTSSCGCCDAAGAGTAETAGDTAGARADGAPHLGQAGARSEISVLQSGQTTSGIATPRWWHPLAYPIG